jgi:hypothetical protein
LKTFHCTSCGALVFYENTACLSCGSKLAFVADRLTMVALTPGEDGRWLEISKGKETADGVTHALCANYVDHDACNWTAGAGATGMLCRSCRLTHVIPDLTVAGRKEAWLQLEKAKRRLLYGILSVQLPLRSKTDDPQRGLEFQFLEDTVQANGDRSRVLTGHDNGLITINVAEADDVYREAQRLRQHEPYRTLLGHFRHEIGHYYWDRLIADSPQIDAFRELFGDERADYQAALKRHYEDGAPPNWSEQFISAYATMHPWEDWAESWAHVMHMTDALETAREVGLSVNPARPDEPRLPVASKPPLARIQDFDRLLGEWAALTYVLNNLTRGLGLADAYPFTLSPAVAAKLRFVCASMALH